MKHTLQNTMICVSGRSTNSHALFALLNLEWRISFGFALGPQSFHATCIQRLMMKAGGANTPTSRLLERVKSEVFGKLISPASKGSTTKAKAK